MKTKRHQTTLKTVQYPATNRVVSAATILAALLAGCVDETPSETTSSVRNVVQAITAAMPTNPNTRPGPLYSVTPVADAGADFDAVAGTRVSLDGTGSSDPNGDTLTYSWTQISGSNVGLSDSTAAQPRLKLPNPETTEILEFELVVSDGPNTSTPSVVAINVNNHAPGVKAMADLPALKNTNVELTIEELRDDDGDPLNVIWTQVSGPPVVINNPTSQTANFTTPNVLGPLVFAIDADDGQVAATQDWVTVWIVRPVFVDDDSDGLSNAAEVVWGTDDQNPDTDGDGIRDGWEVHGHEEVDFPALGCDPMRKNILVELDFQEYIDQGGIFRSARPSANWITEMENFFADLPISNPDGSTGIDITFVEDETLDEDFLCYYETTNSGDSSDANSLYREAFHKAQFCFGNKKGHSPINGRSLKVRASEGDEVTFFQTFVHEMGHSLGLEHGGHNSRNRKPNYPSLMNYGYKLPSVPLILADIQLDFSDGSLPDLDECELSEIDPMPGADLGYLAHFVPSYIVEPNGDVDWNGDGVIDVDPIEHVLRLDETQCVVLSDHNDFAAIEAEMALALPGNPNG
jgi:hypothetical protein